MSDTSYFKCTYPGCSMIFKTKTLFDRHTRVHSGEKPYKCDICGKVFSQSSNLYKHKKTHSNLDLKWNRQTSMKPFKCLFPDCNRSFLSKWSLKNHSITTHGLVKEDNNNNVMHCLHSGCNETFHNSSSLRSHILSYSPAMSLEFYSIIKTSVFLCQTIKNWDHNSKEDKDLILLEVERLSELYSNKLESLNSVENCIHIKNHNYNYQHNNNNNNNNTDNFITSDNEDNGPKFKRQHVTESEILNTHYFCKSKDECSHINNQFCKEIEIFNDNNNNNEENDTINNEENDTINNEDDDDINNNIVFNPKMFHMHLCCKHSKDSCTNIHNNKNAIVTNNNISSSDCIGYDPNFLDDLLLDCFESDDLWELQTCKEVHPEENCPNSNNIN